MKLFISLFFVLNLLTSALLRSDSTSFLTDFSFLDELQMADNLARSSKSEELTHISSLIKDFKMCTERLIEDEGNKEITCELIILAYSLYTKIEQNNLKSYFSDEFLTELEFLSSIAKKSQTLSSP